MLQKFFKLRENRTDIKTETIAGVTTFMTLSYIIFVQPTVLSACGMDFGAVLVATCVSGAAATIIMGLYANYPFALAPGMGQNFFFAYTVVLGMGISWEKALGAVFISGALFLFLSFFGFRYVHCHCLRRECGRGRRRRPNRSGQPGHGRVDAAVAVFVPAGTNDR